MHFKFFVHLITFEILGSVSKKSCFFIRSERIRTNEKDRKNGIKRAQQESPLKNTFGMIRGYIYPYREYRMYL